MIRLKTFGGAVLYDDQQQPIGGAARHRRTIGLLSVLAVAGETGLTRDKLIGIFWPNHDQKRARHSLTQALYAARRATGHDDLFDAGGEDVRLNFDWISSDARDFEAHLRLGEDEAACELYDGRFLDGFFLQTPEFDLWQAQECARLEDRAVAAFNRVVSEADNGGNVVKAVGYARRLTSIRPTDAAAVVNLMRLLANNGDRPAAIAQANWYATVMRGQYEIEPDAAVVEYADELRQAPQASTLLEAASAPLVPALPMPSDFKQPAAAPHAHVAAVKPRSRRLSFAWSGLALLLVVLAIVAVKSQSGESVEAFSGAEQRTLIAPFRMRAADPTLSYLGEGMIELLATRLADDSVDRAMDAAAIIRAWRSANVSANTEIPLSRMVTVARKLGAERVLVGSVVGVPSHVVISASVVGVKSQEITTRASVEGSTDTLAALVDGLARKLLLSQVDAGESLQERLTVSLPSLRAHVRGTAAYARGDYALAQRFYERALALDPSFALAALKLALAASRMGDFEAQRIALHEAWREQHNLGEKDRAFLIAELGPRYPAPSTLAEVVGAWSKAARLAPERAEVWAGLARAMHERRTASHNLTDREPVFAALERALQLDASHVGASVLLAHVRPEQPLIQPAGSTAIASAARAPFADWWRAAVQQPTPSRTDWLESFGPANLRAVALAGQYVRGGLSDSEAALRLLLARAADADDAMTLLTARHSLARNAGNGELAFDATRRMQRTRPVGRAHLRLRVLDALYDRGDSLAALEAVQRLEATSNVPGAPADLCVSAQWHIARGQMEQAAAALEVLRRQGPQTPLIASVQPAMCVPFIEAAVSLVTNPEQGAQQLQVLDSLSFTNTGAGDLAVYANIAVAHMHMRVNQREQALAAIRRRPFGVAAWPRYLAAGLRIEKELCATQQLASQCDRGEPEKAHAVP